MEVSSCCIIIDFKLLIFHHNGINELDMLVCMKLWIGSCYFYLLVYPVSLSMTHDYNTGGKKDLGLSKVP